MNAEDRREFTAQSGMPTLHQHQRIQHWVDFEDDEPESTFHLPQYQQYNTVLPVYGRRDLVNTYTNLERALEGPDSTDDNTSDNDSYNDDDNNSDNNSDRSDPPGPPGPPGPSAPAAAVAQPVPANDDSIQILDVSDDSVLIVDNEEGETSVEIVEDLNRTVNIDSEDEEGCSEVYEVAFFRKNNNHPSKQQKREARKNIIQAVCTFKGKRSLGRFLKFEWLSNPANPSI